MMSANASRQTVGDLAYTVLKSHGEPIYFKELIGQVLEESNYHGDQTPQMIASIHTEINIDSRFVHMGKGMWTLRELIAPKVLKKFDEEWEV